VRTLQALLVEEPDELLDQGLRYWLPVGLEWWRFTVAGQVDEDDLTMWCEPTEDRVPRLAPMPDPVQQHKWFARPDPLVGQPHKNLLPPGDP
jgi:hypothetical protein